MTHLSQFLDLDHFLKITKFKNREIGTREIGYTCRFAKFNTREKTVFKKIHESRNLIPLRYALWNPIAWYFFKERKTLKSDQNTILVRIIFDF